MDYRKKQNMLNLSYFKIKLFLLLFIFAVLLSVEAKTENKQESDSVLAELMQNPELITSYSIEELTEDMSKNRINQMNKVICSLNANGISRSIIKQYYFPLCRKIIESYFHKSAILQKMAQNRTFTLEHMQYVDSISSGRNIISRFIEYQHICMGMIGLPWEYVTPVFYGEMRMIEAFIWGNNMYMEKLDPIPEELIAKINDLFGVKISILEQDLHRLLQTRLQDLDFVTDNAMLLCDASTYLSQYHMGLVCGSVFAVYISQGKKQELLDLIDLVFSRRWGSTFWNKIKPIINYQITGILDVEEVKSFHLYRDSLLSQHIEFSKYYPHKCPDNLKGGIAYEEYNNKFYDALDYIFLSSIKDSYTTQLPFESQLFNSIGCSSKDEFLSIYTEETLRRYYDKGDFRMWGKIEDIRRYLEKSSKYPIDVALHIVECYAPINAIKARDFINQTSLAIWLDKQMMRSRRDANESELRAASVVAYVYASLYNEARYPDILKYVGWVENNIGRIEGVRDGVIYNVASSLSLMGKYKESNDWISKIRVDKSEYRKEFYRLLLENHFELENNKEAIKVASKMDGFSYQDILRLLIVQLREDKDGQIEDLLPVFTSSLSNDFNIFSFMDSEDQSWSLGVAKYRVAGLLTDMDISLWIKEELNKVQNLSLFKSYIAAMRYNWALASKGALLRSNKFMNALVLDKMPKEQYMYFRHALGIEEEDFQEDNLSSGLEFFVSERVKEILLDFVRKDTTCILPRFDYNVVRNQLQSEDIAIELVELDGYSFDVVMIRKQWKYPKLVTFLKLDSEDNSQLLWSYLTPYLTGVQRIYISLDGEYNFENIELTTDSTGVCMGDRYDIYRVSTTLNIPQDVYLSDIRHSVLYGNLTYADSDMEPENEVASENLKRGAIIDRWLPLEDTEKELNVISKILMEANIPFKRYQGGDGNKASFIDLNRQPVDLLHLATHAFYNGEYIPGEDKISVMKKSGIVLSNSAYDLCYSRRSGTIFANEIANMDLNTVKLLVLSACETAKGDIGEDGVYGIQRGFKQAGVGCIVMSLTEVNSVMTTDLMQFFYSYLAKGQSVRKAFRNAQKQIAFRYNMDDWKSFIIID